MMERLNDNQRIISIAYDDMDNLLNRQDHITQTLLNSLERMGNVQEITDSFIRVNEHRYTLNFILTEVE